MKYDDDAEIVCPQRHIRSSPPKRVQQTEDEAPPKKKQHIVTMFESKV